MAMCPEERRFYYDSPFPPSRWAYRGFYRNLGPLRSLVFKLALDTGATDTMVDANRLTSLGYNLSEFPLVKIMTANGTAQVPNLTVARISALGQERTDFPLLAHTLPPTATVDGVLGLDFLRGHVLNIDFRLGKLTLE